MIAPLTACVMGRPPRALRSRRMGRPYTVAQARALHALAESKPTPERYERERARILGQS